MEIAKQLVASMTAKWKPETYHDEYRVALEKYVEAKIHHKIRKTPKKQQLSTSKSNVINFVDLLEKNLEKNKTHHKKKSAK